jgi:hypothetical protein
MISQTAAPRETAAGANRRAKRVKNRDLPGPLPYHAEALEKRLVLSAVSWMNMTGGSWDTPGNWSTGVVPQSGDDVTIDQPGNLQITLAGGASINSLSITGDLLMVASGTLAVAGGVSNSGSITVNAASQLTIGGSYNQASGAILAMPGGGSTTDPTSNLLTNAGFESPAIATSGTTAPSSWPNWGSSFLSNQFAHNGSQSLAASGPNSGVLQSFAVTPGASYTLSVYAMTPVGDKLTGSEAGFLELIYYDSTGTQISPYAPPNSVAVLSASSPAGGPIAGSVGGGGWNHFSITDAAPSNAATVNAILETGAYNGSGAGEGSVYWDDAQFGPSAAGASKVTAASVVNGGAITVGPTNTLTVSGAFTQTAGGTLDLQLGGPPAGGAFGQVSVGGVATLGGTFKSVLVYGYVPGTADEFTPMLFSSASGGFSSYQLPVGAGYQMDGAVTFTHLALATAPITPLTATVNATVGLHTVNSNLLGANLAWWDSALTSSQTRQMVQAAGLTTYRFPGGSSSDDYHFNVAANYGDASAVTIPQLAQVIEAAGGSGLVTLDYGSGSPQEAAAELAYLQGATTDTTAFGTGIEWNDSTNLWQNVDWRTVGYWASLRGASPLATDDGLNFLRINHPAPFTEVKYWEVGNEEYGSWEIDHHGTAGPGGAGTGAQHDPVTYVAFAKSFQNYASEILTTAGLPAVQIGIDSGDPGGSYNNWIANVLTAGLGIGFVPNFNSDHSYMQGPGSESDSFLLNGTVSNPASVLDWTTRYEDYRSVLNQTLGAQGSGVQLMATEFNSVYTNPGKQSTSLVNGLFVADSIGSLADSGYVGGAVWDLRNGWDTSQNNSPALYGWRKGGDYGMLGDPGKNEPPATGAYVPYPNYFAEQLASKFIQNGGEAVSALSSYQDLHTYAVVEPNGDLSLLVINTNPAATLTSQFNLQGFLPGGRAQIWQYGEAQDTAQSQSANGASALANISTTITLNGGSFSFSFAPYSMSVIDLAGVPDVITGTSASDAITLTRAVDQQHIDWKMGAVHGEMTINDPNGLTINGNGGNDTITLDYTSGNPLPDTVHLNGTFTINNLQGTNPLSGTTLDIGRSTLFISYSGSDPLAAIQGYLKGGYNGGAWNGTPTTTTGVITSSAVQGNSNHNTAVGYADSADGQGINTVANTIELKYTLYGDANLDGSVNTIDLQRLLFAFNTSGAWDQGDFNYDGVVNTVDLQGLLFNFNTSVGNQIAAAAYAAANGSAVTPQQTASQNRRDCNAAAHRRHGSDEPHGGGRTASPGGTPQAPVGVYPSCHLRVTEKMFS